MTRSRLVPRLAVVAALASALIACSAPTPAPTMTPAPPDSLNAEGFATTGWEPQTDVLNPFYDRIQVDVTTAEADSEGLAVFRNFTTGEIEPHPIVWAQYAMGALLEWEDTGDDVWLERAIRNAEELIDTHVEHDGAWWYQYDWPWTYIDRTLTEPWWSGMAQGEALTVFSRLAAIQPENPAWRDAAERTFASFPQRGSGNEHPWSTVIVDGYLWFEEYAGDQPPLQVMNGHVFAIFGLYEYWLLTGDEQAAEYIDGGATTILAAMPAIRVEGGVSYYCAQAGYCQQEAWQNGSYHPIHIQQLDALERITGDPAFGDWATLLRSDIPG